MRKQRSNPTRGAVRALVALLASLALVLGLRDAPEHNSLAQRVPADVGLYVELRNGADLLLPLTEPQVWLTLAELAGQPARVEETAAWRLHVQQTINMSPTEAIRALFAQRVAFAGEGLRRSQDAVVLCEPATPPRSLIGRWQARPMPSAGRSAVYQLPNNVGLAASDKLLVFGDNVPKGTFGRVLGLLDGGKSPSLADDVAYQRLIARVPPDPDGVLFARLVPPQVTTAPAETAVAPLELPGPLRGSANVLLALHRDRNRLHFSAVGDAPRPMTDASPVPDELIAKLPERTLLAWAGRVDYAALSQAVNALPELNALRLMYNAQERVGAVERFARAVESAACIAVSIVMPTEQLVAAPPVPAVAVLVAARDRDAAQDQWQEVFGTTLAMYKLLALRAGPPVVRPLEAEVVEVEGLDVTRLDLSSLFAVAEQPPLAELHLCWVMDGNVLILATHTDWLRQIVRARHGTEPPLGTVLERLHKPGPSPRDSIFIAQTGPIADLGAVWIEYLKQAAPAVLNPNWWRSYQPGGTSVRMGVQVTADTERRRLLVRSVALGSPADGILKPGDEIIGCNRRRFATSQPVQEIQRGLHERPNTQWVDLYVERDRVIRIRRVPLPFVDPIQVLRRVMSVGRIVQRVAYADEVPDAAGPRGHLTLELRTESTPLYAFPATNPPPSVR